jgi:F420-dependent oxidoreductase-like protein
LFLQALGLGKMSGMSFGIFLPSYAFQNQAIQRRDIFNQIRNVVTECERLRFNSVWIDDHLMIGNNPVLECWTTLSALAAATTRIRLGTMVTAMAFRNPALLAKMAATVDVISGGRLEFGIGSGVQKQEHEAYGYDFPVSKARISRLKEAVEIIKDLWIQPKTSYKGTHYRITDAVCEPKPLQKPHPPITVGSCGEKYGLKVAAQLADRVDFGYLPSVEAYKRKLQILRNHCKALGRDFDKIEKSCWPTGQILLGKNQNELENKTRHLIPKGMSQEEFETISFIGSPEEFASKLKTYVDLGVAHFMLFFADLPEVGSLRLFSQFMNNNL